MGGGQGPRVKGVTEGERETLRGDIHFMHSYIFIFWFVVIISQLYT